MELLRIIIHYGFHFIIPFVFAKVCYTKKWKCVYLTLLLTMLVDLDHLFSTPVFDVNRLSLGFHFLHSYFAIMVYLIMLFFYKTRILAIGLLFHMFTDGIDYLFYLINKI